MARGFDRFEEGERLINMLLKSSECGGMGMNETPCEYLRRLLDVLKNATIMLEE
jgi:hypothetical protein